MDWYSGQMPFLLTATLFLSTFVQDPKLPVRQEIQVEGWTIHVDQRLKDFKNQELGKQALRLLATQLIQIQVALPKERIERLRKVPVFLDFACGDMFSPAYHPSAVWLKQNGYSEKMEKSVHIPKAEYFVGKSLQTQQPWAMLHEFAHAFHHQDLKYENPEILALYEKFRTNKKYESILHVDGNARKHYGQTNVMEFFAEMSESYVGQNDFFPFNRGELKTAEPEIYALMQKIWGPI